MNLLKTIGAMCVFLILGNAMAQQEVYKEKFFINGNDTLKYRIMYPKNFSVEKEYPLMLFLHGSGERGSDNTSQLTHGSSLFSNEKNRDSFPAIVIFPQCPKESYWSNANVDRSTHPLNITFYKDKAPTMAMKMLTELVDDMLKQTFVKLDQVYVGGLSMGGMGTFELLSRRPDVFAAAFAICGGGYPELSESYAKKVPMWIFHGAKDDVVDPQNSLDMVSAILEYGGHPNFNLYANDNHNSWDSTFAEPNLLPWLFSKTK